MNHNILQNIAEKYVQNCVDKELDNLYAYLPELIYAPSTIRLTKLSLGELRIKLCRENYLKPFLAYFYNRYPIKKYVGNKDYWRIMEEENITLEPSKEDLPMVRNMMLLYMEMRNIPLIYAQIKIDS